MQPNDIRHKRLHNQLITSTPFAQPTEVVKWLGAVQAQDYMGGLWALALRTENATQASIEQAIAARAIVRTWPMRGTIHFVPAEDVRWMLRMLASRTIKGHNRRLVGLGIDDEVLARGRGLLVHALEGGKQLARPSIYSMFEAAGIRAAGQRGVHILFRLALEGLVCFAEREGKQPTFALLDEWVPASRDLTDEEALAKLARRYFTSHGPATAHDFAWWTGLPVMQARRGIDMVGEQLHSHTVDGRTYWLAPSQARSHQEQPCAHLLPPWDEYAVAYRDRGALVDPALGSLDPFTLLGPCLVLNGLVAGAWKREIERDRVTITIEPFRELSEAEHEAVGVAAERYGRFLGLPVRIK